MLYFSIGPCPRALSGMSGGVCGINSILKAIALWEERKKCSVQVLASFFLLVKEATFPPVYGCRVPTRMDLSQDC